MTAIIPKSYEFEKIKKQLKEFSEQYPENFDFEKVKTTAFFFWDHDVTGKELNDTIEKVQGHLVTLKTKQLQLVQEFSEVYNALEILDRDYIQKILIAIKTAEIANEKAKESRDEIEESQREIKKNQNDIKTIIEKQKITISALIDFKKDTLTKMKDIQKQFDELYKFKLKLDSYKHLSDLDNIWEETQKLKMIDREKKEQLDNLLKSIIEIKEKTQNNNDNEIQLINKKLEEVNQKNKIIGIFAYTSCIIGIVEFIFILWRYL